MKIRPVGAEMFHADRRTDIKNLIVTFRNLANAPKMYVLFFFPQNDHSVSQCRIHRLN